MNDLQSPSLNLLDLARLIESQGDLRFGLEKIARQVALSLEADHCSILLFGEGHDRADSLRVFAHYGACLPIKLAGDNIAHHPYPLNVEESISEPILLCEQVIGIIYVTLPCRKFRFNEQDKQILHLYSQQVSQSIHIHHLQTFTKSRFINAAVGQELAENQINPSSLPPHPPTLAKIVAKAFFKELTKAGFCPREIIETATEVLSLLEKTIHKHRQRLDNSRD